MTAPVVRLTTKRDRPRRRFSAQGHPFEARVSEVHGIDSHVFKVVVLVEHYGGDVRRTVHRFTKRREALAFARREMQ